MDVAIIDEMAVMPEKFCYGMIFPMLIMTRAALIILSTFQGGGNNIFARMNKLQLKDKTFLFTVIQLVNICPDCTRKSDIEHGHIHACIHMLPFMPKHHSKRQLEFITVRAVPHIFYLN